MTHLLAAFVCGLVLGFILGILALAALIALTALIGDATCSDV